MLVYKYYAKWADILNGKLTMDEFYLQFKRIYKKNKNCQIAKFPILANAQ